MILVTGGAGYIGSHVVKELLNNKYEVAVIDNLSSGHRTAVPGEVLFKEIDLLDKDSVYEAVKEIRPRAVMHFAAKSIVSESVSDPLDTFCVNLAGTINLLMAMQHFGIKLLVFSSTAAVYGEPVKTPIEENHPLKPTNPYGESKHFIEKILSRTADTGSLSYISLRYFNAAGADPEGELGEDHCPETHLIPLVLSVASGKRDKIVIYGSDYPTADGTPVRDYIHISDLVSAHLLALESLLKGETHRAVYNLGNEQGYSVLEVIDLAKKITGKPIKREYGPKRDGDPSVLIASSQNIKKDLKWNPGYSELKRIIEDAWRWHKNYPEGFND